MQLYEDLEKLLDNLLCKEASHFTHTLSSSCPYAHTSPSLWPRCLTAFPVDTFSPPQRHQSVQYASRRVCVRAYSGMCVCLEAKVRGQDTCRAEFDPAAP